MQVLRQAISLVVLKKTLHHTHIGLHTAASIWLRRGKHKVSPPDMERLEAVLIDLSGTIHIEDTAITGAQDALKT